ncbi:hypothetical protein D5086_005126 [Populus alba]|uniref:Uncharacterized protein n=1 Tax=Populus alba TaxID=43335 RepID=A0ACC4CSV4_POPAL
MVVGKGATVGIGVNVRSYGADFQMGVGSSSECAWAGLGISMHVGVGSLYYNIGSDSARFSKEDATGYDKDYWDNDFSKDDEDYIFLDDK